MDATPEELKEWYVVLYMKGWGGTWKYNEGMDLCDAKNWEIIKIIVYNCDAFSFLFNVIWLSLDINNLSKIKR